MAIQWTGLFANTGYSSANNKTQDDAVTGMQDTLYVTGPGYGAYEAVVRLYNSTGALVASVNVSGGGGALSAPPPVRFVDNGTVYSYSLEVVRGYIPTEDADGIVIRLVGGASKRYPSPMSVTPSGDVQFGGAVIGPDDLPIGANLSGNVCVSDSLSARYTNGGWYEYLHQLSMQRTRNRGNFAQFGWNLDQMAAQVDQALATHAETIYIMGGTNVRIFPGLGSNLVDALKSAGHYMEILLAKIGRRRKVVILGVPPSSATALAYYADYCEQWNKMLQFIASAWGADFRYQWEHLVDKSTGGADATKFQADLLHPIQYQQKVAADRIIANDSRILGCYLPQRDIVSPWEYYSDPLNLRAGSSAGLATGWTCETPGTAILSLDVANSGFGRKQVLDSNGTATSPVLMRRFDAFPRSANGCMMGRIKMTTTDPSGSASCYFAIRFLDAAYNLIQEDYIQAPIAAMDGIFCQRFVSPPAFAMARLQLQFTASKPKSVVEFEQVQVYDIDAMMAYRP